MVNNYHHRKTTTMFVAAATTMVMAVAIAVLAAIPTDSQQQSAFADKPNQSHFISSQQSCYEDYFTGQKICENNHQNLKFQSKTK
jgi:hypothetical protein